MRKLLPTLLLLTAAAGCGGDGGTTASPLDREVVVTFADAVVVPTYQDLSTRVAALDAAVVSLAAAPDAGRLTAAQQAWISARVPWEQSEGFLFGPVDANGYDPALDSWPVNRTDLDAVLASNDALTPEYVRNLQETQKGFHTLEYLLFGQDRTRVAGELTARQLEYARALSAEMKDTAAALAASWTAGPVAYRDVFAGAGQAGNTAYPSVESAAQEMLGGMSGILDEVANGKIADPFDAKDPELVESQFAFNSIADFQDNIRSVENAYLGHLPGRTKLGRALADVVVEADASLDTRVRSEIAAAIAALGAIPGPSFSAAVKDPQAADEIVAAQRAIRALQATLDGPVTQVVLP